MPQKLSAHGIEKWQVVVCVCILELSYSYLGIIGVGHCFQFNMAFDSLLTFLPVCLSLLLSDAIQPELLPTRQRRNTHCIQICSNLWADRNTQTFHCYSEVHYFLSVRWQQICRAMTKDMAACSLRP